MPSFPAIRAALLACLTASTFAAQAAEMRPLVARTKVNPSALYKIQRLMDRALSTSMPAYPADVVVEPVIAEMRFIGGGKRFWAGPIAGSSRVRMQVNIKRGDATWSEEFYEDSGAWAGSWTIGHSDNVMLERIANRAVNFIQQRPWELEAGVAPAHADVPGERRTGLPSTPAAEAAQPSEDLYSQLMKLDELRLKGIITEEEFQAQKRKVLEAQ
jgi:hypothetical protein